MPTLHFLLYLLVCAAAWVLRLSYLGWFGPYFLLCTVSLPLFLALLSLPSMLSARLEAQTREYTVRGERTALRLRVSFPRLLLPCRVRVWVTVENRFAGESCRFREDIFEQPEGELALPLPTGLCGQLRCRITRWECRDLLGLFKIRRRCPEAQLCTVLPPAVGPETPLDLDAALDAAAVLKPKYGGGYSEEHELREYRPGDAANSIHWKLSSKTDSLIVREALERENDQIFLLLSRVGAKDRGLELLRWLSDELCRRELPHILVADRLYPVANEQSALDAFCSLLSSPLAEPVRFDATRARCVFSISDGEVRIG